MDRPLLGEELEKAFVRSCGPVLLGAKPANLLTFCGCFDEDCSVCDKGCRQNQPRESNPLVEQRRKKLAHLVDELDAKLSACGVRCVVLAWRPFGALVYAYRPSLVAHHIKHAPIAHDLSVRGYPIERLEDRSHPLPSEMPSRNINRPIRQQEEERVSRRRHARFSSWRTQGTQVRRSNGNAFFRLPEPENR